MQHKLAYNVLGKHSGGAARYLLGKVKAGDEDVTKINSVIAGQTQGLIDRQTVAANKLNRGERQLQVEECERHTSSGGTVLLKEKLC